MTYREKSKRDTRRIFGLCAVAWLAVGVGLATGQERSKPTPGVRKLAEGTTESVCPRFQYMPYTVVLPDGSTAYASRATYTPDPRRITFTLDERVFCSRLEY